MSTPAGWAARAVAGFTSTDVIADCQLPIGLIETSVNRQLAIGNLKMRPNISHYCQKCLAANPLGQEFCTRCGTRLMIVVEPSATRYEVAPASLSTDEHLLERISAAENRVARLAERLERSLDLLLRYAQNAY